MTTRWGSWAATTALVLTAGLTLAACGDKDDPKADPSPSASASSPADAADTLSQDEFAATVSAAIAEAGSVHVALDLADLSGEGDIAYAADGATSALAFTINDIDLVFADGTYFVNLGQASGGRFLSVDPASTGSFSTQFGDLLAQANPASQLEILGSAIQSFAVGAETTQIDGVTATPYVLTVDPGAILNADQQDQLGDNIPATIDVTIHLGPDHLPRRVSTTVGTTALTLDYTAWGAPVDIAAPPADQVSDGAAFGL